MTPTPHSKIHGDATASSYRYCPAMDNSVSLWVNNKVYRYVKKGNSKYFRFRCCFWFQAFGLNPKGRRPLHLVLMPVEHWIFLLAPAVCQLQAGAAPKNKRIQLLRMQRHLCTTNLALTMHRNNQLNTLKRGRNHVSALPLAPILNSAVRRFSTSSGWQP